MDVDLRFSEAPNSKLRATVSYVLYDCGLHLQYNADSHSPGVALHSGVNQ